MTREPVSFTLFTTCKPFSGLHSVIQRNAVASWLALEPRPEVLLIGDDEGTAEAAAELGGTHVGSPLTNEFGTPLVSDLFQRAHELGHGLVLVFLNADILLPAKWADAVERVARRFDRFLVVGRRLDVDVTQSIDFTDPSWSAQLTARALKNGHERGDLCIDWFAFSPSLFRDLPPFAIGRTRYDTWLVWQAAQEGATVVDASAFVKVLHQNHDYGHVGGSIAAWEGPEAQRAGELIGHWSHAHSIAHATVVLTPSGDLVPASSMRHRLARPKRTFSHYLRFTRPLRRRLSSRRSS